MQEKYHKTKVLDRPMQGVSLLNAYICGKALLNSISQTMVLSNTDEYQGLAGENEKPDEWIDVKLEDLTLDDDLAELLACSIPWLGAQSYLQNCQF